MQHCRCQINYAFQAPDFDFRFVKKTPLISLAELRKHKPLAKMRVLAKGNRLSITPVDPDEWKYILGLAK